MTGIRILVVDDDADAASELAELLETAGYTVRTAHNLGAARKERSAFSPDWALVDIRLGRENGLDLAREWGEAGSPRVVLLSGLDAAADLAAMLPQPPPVLLKPVSLDQLTRIIAS